MTTDVVVYRYLPLTSEASLSSVIRCIAQGSGMNKNYQPIKNSAMKSPNVCLWATWHCGEQEKYNN